VSSVFCDRPWLAEAEFVLFTALTAPPPAFAAVVIARPEAKNMQAAPAAKMTFTIASSQSGLIVRFRALNSQRAK